MNFYFSRPNIGAPDRQFYFPFMATTVPHAHAEAIEEFYTPDASMQENNAPPRRGRDALARQPLKP
jgi:hypothetical protein